MAEIIFWAALSGASLSALFIIFYIGAEIWKDWHK